MLNSDTEDAGVESRHMANDMGETSPQRLENSRGWLIKELPFLLTVVAVLALDQVSKFLVRANMYPGQYMPQEGFFRLTYITNTGGVFGILQHQTFLISIATLVGIAVILLYTRFARFNSMVLRVAFGLLLGGSIGNLIDRVFLGSVVDFIDIGIGHYRWPTFNLADSALVVGVIIVLYYLLFSARRQDLLKT